MEIPALPDRVSWGRLSPDGSQLLLGGIDTNVAKVFRLDLDSGRLYAYPATETDGISPVWHPDGQHALFGFPGTRLLDLETGDVTLLSEEYKVHFLADATADGRLLAAVSEGCWAIGAVLLDLGAD